MAPSDREDFATDPASVGTRLLIVRHGEAHCNVGEFIGGHGGCRGLTDRGVEQVAALIERARATDELAGAEAIVTSVLPRAIETAELLAKGLSLGPVETTCELCERHPGEADGMTWAQFEVVYKKSSLPGEHPYLPLSPGGESWVAFLDRAERALLSEASSHRGGLVVVVAHGGIIDASIIRLLELPAHGSQIWLHPEHTSLTEWEYIGRRWRLVRYNDAAHLGGPARSALVGPPPGFVRRDRLSQQV